MAKRIITISREFGSGGRFIGEELAKNWDSLIMIKTLSMRSQKSLVYLRNIFRKVRNCLRKRLVCICICRT